MSSIIQFRARDPGDATTDTDLYDVRPLRDAFKRFASGATALFKDFDATKKDSYPYGTRVELQYTTDSGSSWNTRLAGTVLDGTRTTGDGIPAFEAAIVGYSHLLRRRKVTKNYNDTISNILNDLITSFTSVKWVAGNVSVQNDKTINRDFRGEKVDEIIAFLASESANENWGVNNSLEFFFQQQDTARATKLGETDVIDYELPEKGKRAVNRYQLYYGSNLGNAVIVEDREVQNQLKDELAAPRRVVIGDSDAMPEITTRSIAEAIARQRIGERRIIQTGELITPLGFFDTESGDVFELTIGDAGISGTDFRVAQIDYEWREGKSIRKVTENVGDVDDLLAAMSDSLDNVRQRDNDPNASEVLFLDLRSGVTATLTATLTTKTNTSDSFVVGQSQVGRETVGGGVDSTSSVSVEGKRATTSFLNMLRDVVQGESFTDITHVAVGTDDTTPTRADSSLQAEVDRVSIEKFGKGDSAAKIEYVATVPAGGVFADANDLKEFSVVSSDSGGDHHARVTFDDTAIDASTRLKIHLEIELDNDGTQQGVITDKGQERWADLAIGETGHEPSDMTYGTGTTAPDVTDTALGSKSHEDTIDSTSDFEPGVVLFVEEVTSGDADTTNFSEIGEENSANELLSRVVFEAIPEDLVLVTDHEWQAQNA